MQNSDVYPAEAEYLVHIGVEGVLEGLSTVERRQYLCAEVCWKLFDEVAHRGESDGWYGILGNVIGAGLFVARFEKVDPHFDMVRAAMNVLADVDAEQPMSSVEITREIDGLLTRVM